MDESLLEEDINLKRVIAAESTRLFSALFDAIRDQVEERMRDMIEALEEQNPQEIAEKILSYAICSCGGRIRDDMTVFVLCLWENA